MATNISFKDVVGLANGDVGDHAWLDGSADKLQQAVKDVVQRGGEPAQRFKDFLHGIWLGHPLHPMLTDITIGAWTFSVAADLLGLKKVADPLLGVGIVSAIPTAMSGAADWSETEGRSRRVGLIHAGLNTAALSLFCASLVARGSGARGAGRAMSLAGFGLANVSAWLGGSLVFKLGTGVERNSFKPDVDEWTYATSLNNLPDAQLYCIDVKVEDEELPLLLFRRGGEVVALADACNHWGASLSEGTIEGDCVRCPWHGSTFNLYDGHVVRGPAASTQPSYETRVRDGNVEVKRRSSVRQEAA